MAGKLTITIVATMVIIYATRGKLRGMDELI
jgi:hypothetical protein